MPHLTNLYRISWLRTRGNESLGHRTPVKDDYYDEGLPDHVLYNNVEKDKQLFPPERTDMSDARIIVVVRSDLTGLERRNRHPDVFAFEIPQSGTQEPSKPFQE